MFMEGVGVENCSKVLAILLHMADVSVVNLYGEPMGIADGNVTSVLALYYRPHAFIGVSATH